MFIIELTYIKPLSDVERFLPDHIAYLDQNYKSGHFIISGRKNPRTGGVIIAKAKSIEEINRIYHTDSFYINNIAQFNVIEVIPSKWGEELNRYFL